MLSKQIKYPIIQYKKLFLKQKIFSQIVIIKEDDCRCTKCKNLELVLITSQHSLRKSKQNDLAAK